MTGKLDSPKEKSASSLTQRKMVQDMTVEEAQTLKDADSAC